MPSLASFDSMASFWSDILTTKHRTSLLVGKHSIISKNGHAMRTGGRKRDTENTCMSQIERVICTCLDKYLPLCTYRKPNQDLTENRVKTSNTTANSIHTSFLEGQIHTSLTLVSWLAPIEAEIYT